MEFVSEELDKRIEEIKQHAKSSAECLWEIGRLFDQIVNTKLYEQRLENDKPRYVDGKSFYEAELEDVVSVGYAHMTKVGKVAWRFTKEQFVKHGVKKLYLVMQAEDDFQGDLLKMVESGETFTAIEQREKELTIAAFDKMFDDAWTEAEAKLPTTDEEAKVTAERKDAKKREVRRTWNNEAPPSLAKQEEAIKELLCLREKTKSETVARAGFWDKYATPEEEAPVRLPVTQSIYAKKGKGLDDSLYCVLPIRFIADLPNLTEEDVTIVLHPKKIDVVWTPKETTAELLGIAKKDVSS